jgi:peroxiredoxin
MGIDMRTSSAAALLILTMVTLQARDYGPPIGARMPNFGLPDQDGKAHTLKSLLGPKGAVILIFRSADWCPYCKAQLVELEQHQNEFAKLGLNVAAISYDSTAVLRNFAERKSIHFPLLSDPNSKIIRALGILNETVAKDSPQYGIPHPGVFVLDARGVIGAKYFEDDYRQRYTAAGILLHQFGLIPAAEKNEIQGKQIKVTTSASSSTVTAGQRVVLTLDLELKPNMHVYAPGVENYIPIEWKMKDAETAVAQDPAFPAAQKLHLDAINETVPAYSGLFRLTRDINIEQADKLRPAVDSSGHFRVESTLRYQACDDRICYIPQEMPVHWTFRYEQLDAERVPAELQRKGRGSSQ